MSSLLPVETRLLFHAIAPNDQASDTHIAALLRGRVDWRAFAALAERERMIPVAWMRLRSAAPEVPTDIAVTFDRRTAVNHFQMATASSLLDAVIRRFAAAGIPTMLLKGAALGRSVYPSFVQRPMTDLDILLPREESQVAWSMLRDDGWTLEHEEGTEFHADHHHLRPIVDPRRTVVLEIHHSMMPAPGPFTIEGDELWRRAKQIDTNTWIPSPEHLLLHLSVHLAWSDALEHGIARGVRDVAVLAERSGIDWDAFVDLAEGARAATCAYWTLALARTLVHARVPSNVLERLRPRLPRIATRALERAYIASGVLGLKPSVRMSHALWSAGVHPVRSGHGAHRPWDATTRFYEIFEFSHDTPLLTRIRAQMRDANAWFRFARTIGGFP